MSTPSHTEPEPIPTSGRLSRRMVVAGVAAAGLAPLVGKTAGAQSFGSADTTTTEPTTTTTGPTTTTSTTEAPVAPGDPLTGSLDGIEVDPTGGEAIGNAFGFDPARPKGEVHLRPMMFPVLNDPSIGSVSWSDTYGACRAGCSRYHEGQDLMGPKMLKLLAAVDGTIVELRHRSSGNSLYLKGDDGWYYCYLHINNDDPGTDNGANRFEHAFAPGMVTGKRVLKGEHIAYLGDSGNAEHVSHCHFEIRMPNAKWYHAAAVNAAYSLNAAEPAKIRPKVPNSTFAPLPNARWFAAVQADDFLGGVPSEAWLNKAEQDLESGELTPDEFIEQNVLGQYGATNQSAPCIRLYLAFFLRIPDYGGLDYWIRKTRAGTPLDLAASQFAAGSEFRNTYGELDNAAYLRQIYLNLFGREPDPSGADYWGRRLDGGAKRGWVMRQFCESAEYRADVASKVRVTQVYSAMLRRSPDPSGYSYWSNKDATSSSGLRELIKSIRTGSSYANRF